MNFWQSCKNCISVKLVKNVMHLKTELTYFSKTFAVSESEQGGVFLCEKPRRIKISTENLNLSSGLEVEEENSESTTLDNFKNILMSLEISALATLKRPQNVIFFFNILHLEKHSVPIVFAINKYPFQDTSAVSFSYMYYVLFCMSANEFIRIVYI